jgi:hypothetical protein
MATASCSHRRSNARGLIAERRMPPLPFVEDLEVIEQLGARRRSRGPRRVVDELDLQRREKLSATALTIGGAPLVLSKPLLAWVNDGLMTMFSFSWAWRSSARSKVASWHRCFRTSQHVLASIGETCVGACRGWHDPARRSGTVCAGSGLSAGKYAAQPLCLGPRVSVLRPNMHRTAPNNTAGEDAAYGRRWRSSLRIPCPSK